jgi:hypothetical protein
MKFYCLYILFQQTETVENDTSKLRLLYCCAVVTLYIMILSLLLNHSRLKSCVFKCNKCYIVSNILKVSNDIPISNSLIIHEQISE